MPTQRLARKLIKYSKIVSIALVFLIIGLCLEIKNISYYIFTDQMNKRLLLYFVLTCIDLWAIIGCIRVLRSINKFNRRECEREKARKSKRRREETRRKRECEEQLEELEDIYGE